MPGGPAGERRGEAPAGDGPPHAAFGSYAWI